MTASPPPGEEEDDDAGAGAGGGGKGLAEVGADATATDGATASGQKGAAADPAGTADPALAARHPSCWPCCSCCRSCLAAEELAAEAERFSLQPLGGFLRACCCCSCCGKAAAAEGTLEDSSWAPPSDSFCCLCGTGMGALGCGWAAAGPGGAARSCVRKGFFCPARRDEAAALACEKKVGLTHPISLRRVTSKKNTYDRRHTWKKGKTKKFTRLLIRASSSVLSSIPL